MSDPLFEVDESGEEVTRADTAASTTEMSHAEKAATREEHVRLAEGALVGAAPLDVDAAHEGEAPHPDPR